MQSTVITKDAKTLLAFFLIQNVPEIKKIHTEKCSRNYQAFNMSCVPAEAPASVPRISERDVGTLLIENFLPVFGVDFSSELDFESAEFVNSAIKLAIEYAVDPRFTMGHTSFGEHEDSEISFIKKSIELLEANGWDVSSYPCKMPAK